MGKKSWRALHTLLFKLAFAASVFLFMLWFSHNPHIINYRAFLNETLGQTNKWSHSYGPALFVNINRDISAIGGPTEMIIITCFVSVYLFFVKEKKILLKFITAVLITGILLFSLKYLFNHNRPDSFLDFIFADNLSFPSGHAMASFVVFSILADYINRKISDNKARFVVKSSAVVLIILIGISRVIVGSHDPWQVVAGWCAGFFLLSIINYFGGIHPDKKSKSF